MSLIKSLKYFIQAKEGRILFYIINLKKIVILRLEFKQIYICMNSDVLSENYQYLSK